jgi:hypothetical protein
MNVRNLSRLWSGILTLVVLLGVTVSPATALVVATTTGNTSAPADDFGFAHAGRLNGSTAVYLGYGWVLTATHVGTGTVQLNGLDYSFVAGSDRILLDPTGRAPMGQADLRLFKVRNANGLTPRMAPLVISETSLLLDGADRPVTMVGGGVGRYNEPWAWHITGGSYPNGEDWQWSAHYTPPLYDANELRGFGIDYDSRQLRWGTNTIEGYHEMMLFDRWIVGMETRLDEFDEFGQPLPDCQVMAGDSGGGVFYKRGDQWELTGIIHAMSKHYSNQSAYVLYPNQPVNTLMLTSVSGHAMYSYLSDLSVYRDQILDTIMPIPGDANLDGNVNDVDASILAANWLIPSDALWEDGDFNSDGRVDDSDAAIMAAHWHETAAEGVPPGTPAGDAAAVPEPAALALLAGMAAVLLLRFTLAATRGRASRR